MGSRRWGTGRRAAFTVTRISCWGGRRDPAGAAARIVWRCQEQIFFVGYNGTAAAGRRRRRRRWVLLTIWHARTQFSPVDQCPASLLNMVLYKEKINASVKPTHMFLRPRWGHVWVEETPKMCWNWESSHFKIPRRGGYSHICTEGRRW